MALLLVRLTQRQPSRPKALFTLQSFHKEQLPLPTHTWNNTYKNGRKTDIVKMGKSISVLLHNPANIQTKTKNFNEAKVTHNFTCAVATLKRVFCLKA